MHRRVFSYNDGVRTRIKIAAFCLIPVVCALIWRFYVVQVKKHDYYFAEARKRYVAVRKTSGKRGEIFDVNGHLLVGNEPCVKITCSPCELKDDVKRRKLSYLLVRSFGESYMYWYKRLNPVRNPKDKNGRPILDKNGRPVELRNTYQVIGRTVDIRTAEFFRNQLKANRLPLGAFSFEETYARAYPKGRMLANVLGYINIVDDAAVPQAGLEKQLSSQTSPESGRMVYERARDGSPIGSGVQNMKESHDGKNIYLTISEPVQAILEEELDAAYAEFRPDAVYAAIADPYTGNILALAQRPTFDPNDRTTFLSSAIRSRIADDAFEPGSVVKPFSIGKALDWRIVKPETLIDCEKGNWYYMGKPMRDTHNYDKLTVSEVIQKSSNIGTAKVALMLGEQRMCHALQLFGFGTRTGLPFPSETAGVKPAPRPRDKLAVTRMPIGYNMSVTPLQMLRAYCALANGGRLPKLRLVDRIEDPESGDVVKTPVELSAPLFERPEALSQLVEMMIRVTQKGGTATKAAIPGYPVAGKTGTSRKYKAGVGYVAGSYYGSFVGFVPARAPKLVMVVTMDNPRGASYGGTVAGPTFKRSCQRILKYWNVAPDPADNEENRSGQKSLSGRSAVTV